MLNLLQLYYINIYILEINIFIHEKCIKMIKSNSKGFKIVTKKYILNKCRSFELSIHL